MNIKHLASQWKLRKSLARMEWCPCEELLCNCYVSDIFYLEYLEGMSCKTVWHGSEECPMLACLLPFLSSCIASVGFFLRNRYQFIPNKTLELSLRMRNYRKWGWRENRQQKSKNVKTGSQRELWAEYGSGLVHHTPTPEKGDDECWPEMPCLKRSKYHRCWDILKSFFHLVAAW